MQGGAVAPGQIEQPAAGFRVECGLDAQSFARSLRRIGPVGGQSEGADVTQRFLPITQLPVAFVLAEPGTLPDRIVGVLDGKSGRWLGLFAAGRFVGGAQFVHEHTHRPAVGNDVVHGQENDVPGLRHPKQGGAPERSGRQIEGCVGFGFDLAVECVLGRRTRQLDLSKRDGRGRIDDLDRGVLIGEDEPRAQGFVPCGHLVQCALEGFEVERTRQVETGGDRVARTLRIQRFRNQSRSC